MSPNLGKSWLPDPFNHLISQGEVHASLTGFRIQWTERNKSRGSKLVQHVMHIALQLTAPGFFDSLIYPASSGAESGIMLISYCFHMLICFSCWFHAPSLQIVLLTIFELQSATIHDDLHGVIGINPISIRKILPKCCKISRKGDHSASDSIFHWLTIDCALAQIQVCSPID